jgi:dienelactone hydrolase
MLAALLLLALAAAPAQTMVDGIVQWLLARTAESPLHRHPTPERLRFILGLQPPQPSTLTRSGLIHQNPLFRVYQVRWSVLDGLTAEGLLFEPRSAPTARIAAIPDASQLPEHFPAAQRLAAAGAQVLVPVLIGREETYSGHPRIRYTNQSHREFLYRMAFEVGRHPQGYEVQKVLAALDWFSSQPPPLPLGVWGYGEGGAIALFSAALDRRLRAAAVSGYFAPREDLWLQPLDRNVFGLLRDFGDAELASLAAPRPVFVDLTPGPTWRTHPETRDRRGAAPGLLSPPPEAAVRREAARARNATVAQDALAPFLRTLGLQPKPFTPIQLPAPGCQARARRQFYETLDFTQRLVRNSQLQRDAIWAGPLAQATPGNWPQLSAPLRDKLWNEVIGRLPASNAPLNLRLSPAAGAAGFDALDVTYDIFEGVIGSGVLLLPKGIPPGERRPVVVAQHGLDGRPQDLYNQPPGSQAFRYYQNIANTFADLGYIVYLPQNPYTGAFRRINRLANPLGWSLFSFILAQQQRLLEWLAARPDVDPARIAFYGLSYGGKTALRIPPLLDRYALSVCSGDFNEWITKVAGYDFPMSYLYTHEYEIPEFNLAAVANHGEMALLMAPRPFLVERGHRDPVGIDEMVAYEFAKVRRFYDEMGIGDRAAIVFFNGPHMIHGVEAVAFVRRRFGR